ncbi:hypothetical protein ACU4GD_36500 [Cupriavidus basilensis]
MSWSARDGGRNPDYREEDGQRVMKQAEITVRIALGARRCHRYGLDPATCRMITFRINADYRS